MGVRECHSEPPPLLVTDGQYVFAHHLGMQVGPFNLNDVPFNPKYCIGGKIHTVDNILFPPDDLFNLEVLEGW